jgi:hypothetical protein
MKRLLILLLLLGVVSSVWAVDRDWTNGSGTRLWTTAGNWNGGVPTSADKAAIRGNFVSNGPIINAGMNAVANQIVIGDWSSGQDALDITGGTLTTSGTSCWIILGYGASNNGVINISGGTVNAGSTLYVGFMGQGAINMTGGQINVSSTFGIGQSGGSGDVYLDGGTITCSSLNVASGSQIDISLGTLKINGDATSQVNGYISSGAIVAYGGSGSVSYDYNISNPGVTTVTATAPGKASYPNPSNGATGVSLTPTLSWTAGTGATSHDVYFGSSNPPTFRQNQTGTTYNPGTLQLNTTYYWRIDEIGGQGTITGDVWTFTTTTGTAVLRKGPYLIYPGVNTQMTVLWQLSATESCSIDWGTDTSYGSSANVPEYGTDHQYRYNITNLTPGVKYYYKVTTGAGINTGSFTAAPASNATNVKLFMYGDTRSNPASHNTVATGMVNTYTGDSGYQTICLHAGDWVESDSETTWTSQWFTGNSQTTKLYEFIRNVPLAGCIGNHEGGASVFRKYWPFPFVNSEYWSFDYGPVHVAVVDQYNAGGYSVGSNQYNWLVNDLSTSTKSWKIIVLHEPGWACNGGHPNNTTVQNVIQPLCTQYGVQIVLAGHVHYYSRAVVDEIQHVTNGAGGAPAYTPQAGQPYVVTYSSPLAFCKVEINGDSLTCTTLRPDAVTVLDSFTIGTPPPPPPGQATNPSPSNGASNVSISTDLSWTAGSGAASHDVYFGTDPTPDATEFQGTQSGTTFDPGTLAYGTTYYWRIDETNANGTTTGLVWSFTTASAPQPPGQAANPSPANGAANVSITADLSWTAGSGATSHDVYFGTSSPGTFQGNQAGTTFDTGTMAFGTTYYWRIDEINAYGTTTGNVWSFTTEAPCSASTSHVESIVCATAAGSRGNKYGQVTVTVYNNCGEPVSGANVTGTFTGGFNEQITATTNGSGVAVLTTTEQTKKPSYTFCVDGITHATLTYNSSENVQTCGSY